MVYIYKQHQANQGTTATLGGAQQTLTFKTDASSVYNFSKGFLMMDMVVNTPGNANNFNYVYADQVPFNQVVVRSSSGVEYARITNLRQYLKHVQPVNTKLEDYAKTNPCIPAGGANAVATAPSRYLTVNPCSHAAAFTPTEVGVVTCADTGSLTTFTVTSSIGASTVSPAQLNTGFLAATGALTLTNTVRPSNRFVYTGADGAAAGFLVSAVPTAAARTSIFPELSHQRLIRSDVEANGTLSYSYYLPMKDILHSILSMDEDLFFDDVITIEFQTCLLAELGYQAAADFQPADDIAGAVLSNINLWLPQQQDLDIIEEVKSEFIKSAGYKEIPRLICNEDSFAAGVDINRSYELSTSDGHKFVAAYYTITKDADYARNISYSANGNHWLTTRTSINSKFLQDGALGINTGEAYQWLYPRIKNSSVIGQQEYQVAPLWCDIFVDVEDTTELNSARDGLDLSASQLRYGITATKNAGAPGLLLTWLAILTPFSLKNRTQLPAPANLDTAPIV